MKSNENKKFVFFGTDSFAYVFLKGLKNKGLMPSLIICGEDKPKNRGLKVYPPPVKVWAIENDITFLQPQKLDSEVGRELSVVGCRLFVVASYGKIIPKEILNIPEHGTLNIHPSMLPRLRGPSPIQELILREETPGVTIIKLDEKVDHGPILAQKEMKLGKWPIKASILSPLLANFGAELFLEILPDLLSSKLEEKTQDESLVTYSKKIKKEDARINLSDDQWENYKKILAYDIWPRAFFFAEKNGKPLRVVITSAVFENGKLKIEKVIPENKKEMPYEVFRKNMD